jgi:hypothetical protein
MIKRLPLNKDLLSLLSPSKSPALTIKSPDLKKLENLKSINDLVSELIQYGIQNNLLGNVYKKKSTMNYLEKLLLNMKKLFNKMLTDKNEYVNEYNKDQLIKDFMKNHVNDKIESISKNLISCCLTKMEIENSKIWLMTYLPIIMNYMI